MDDFKHVNLNETRRKLNNWRRKINSNTLNEGLVKKTTETSPPVESVTPSEISSLCSKDDIFKILQKNTILKLRPNPKPQRLQPKLQQSLKSKPVVKIPPIKSKIVRPPSPLVFLDIDKFKNKSYGNTITQPKKSKPVVKNTTKQPEVQPELREQNQTEHKQQTKSPKIAKDEKTLKINTQIRVKNNKKCLENTNRFSLQMIKQNLNKNNIKTTDDIPERLCRDIYMLCNLQI